MFDAFVFTRQEKITDAKKAKKEENGGATPEDDEEVDGEDEEIEGEGKFVLTIDPLLSTTVES